MTFAVWYRVWRDRDGRWSRWRLYKDFTGLDREEAAQRLAELEAAERRMRRRFPGTEAEYQIRSY